MNDTDTSKPIRCILSDVDGVLTDGRITYGTSGEETKQFHTRDGLGIKLWMGSGHRFGILTARNSPMVKRRAEELGIHSVQQGFAEKWPAALETIRNWGFQPKEVCYIGDDLPDLSVMQRIGLSVCPNDAASSIRQQADWVLRSNGGEGVVRELIERLLVAKQLWNSTVEKYTS